MADNTTTALKTLITGDSLPSPPQVAIQIVRICNDPQKGAADLAEVIALDPYLAARTLDTANSAHYFRGRALTSVPRAVAALGSKVVSAIALGFSLKASVPQWQCQAGIDDSTIWKRSIATAVASRRLAAKLHFIEKDMMFLCGLVSRIGQQLMGSLLADEYRQAVDLAGGQLPMAEHERQVFGMSHHEVGAMLARQWNLPELICETTGNLGSNADDLQRDELRRSVSIVRTADMIAGLLFAPNKGELLIATHEEGIGSLAIDADDLDSLIVECESEFNETLGIFEVPDRETIDCSGVLDAAREQLVKLSLGLASDLSESRQCQRELEAMNVNLSREVLTDPLTGIPNRASLDVRLDEMTAYHGSRCESYSIVMVDLDHFKSINDSHGHSVGDTVLSWAAQTLASMMRESDTIARYGGEEFLIILPNTTGPQAAGVAERCRVALSSRPLVTDDMTSIEVTASFGVASLHEFRGIASATELLQESDAALYTAKRRGRNQVVLARGSKATDRAGCEMLDR